MSITDSGSSHIVRKAETPYPAFTAFVIAGLALTAGMLSAVAIQYGPAAASPGIAAWFLLGAGACVLAAIVLAAIPNRITAITAAGASALGLILSFTLAIAYPAASGILPGLYDSSTTVAIKMIGLAVQAFTLITAAVLVVSESSKFTETEYEEDLFVESSYDPSRIGSEVEAALPDWVEWDRVERRNAASSGIAPAGQPDRRKATVSS